MITKQHLYSARLKVQLQDTEALLLVTALTDVLVSTSAFSDLAITSSTDRRAGFYQCFLTLGYY